MDYKPPINKDDELDMKLLKQRIENRRKLQGPRVGDFLIRHNGDLTRFTYDWDDKIQTASMTIRDWSFYFDKTGFMDYSGALDDGISKKSFTDTGKRKFGPAWFFHHDEVRAHNGITVMVPCRVYREI